MICPIFRSFVALLVAVVIGAGCDEQLRPCETAAQCPVNLACVDGFCRRAPFIDTVTGTGDLAETPDVEQFACQVKGAGPGPRAEASGGVVSGLIVAMGGEAGLTGRCGADLDVKSDAWLQTRCDSWAAQDPKAWPPPRTGAATVVDQTTGQLFMYGGRHRETGPGSWVPRRDLRVFDRSNLTWKTLSSTGTSAVSFAGLALDRPRDRLFLIGGDTSLQPGKLQPTGLVMIFDLKTKQWTLSTAKGAPPARSRHAIAMSDHDTHLYVLGGVLQSGGLDPTLWRLDIAANKWEIVATPKPAPTGRAGAVLVRVPGQRRLLLFGGADSTAIGFRNDVWRLDTEKLRWDRLSDGDLGIDKEYGGKLDVGDGVNCNSGKPGGGLPASFMELAHGAPQRRAFMIGGWDTAAGAMVIFGGRGDCGALADTWQFEPGAALWKRLQASETGTSCPRRKAVKPGQKLLCELLCEP